MCLITPGPITEKLSEAVESNRDFFFFFEECNPQPFNLQSHLLLLCLSKANLTLRKLVSLQTGKINEFDYSFV